MKFKPLAVAAALGSSLMLASVSHAALVHRMVSDFQNNTSVGGSGEIVTNLPADPGGAGGQVVYDVLIPDMPADTEYLYITFSAQADVHNGSALLMNAKVNGNLVEPLRGQTAGGGDGPFLQTGWWTLLHPPTGVEGTCGDGGGGTADCHDNNIHFSGCYVLGPNDPKTQARVTIGLADMPGGGDNFAFYERATIYIDGQPRGGRNTFCRGVGTELVR